MNYVASEQVHNQGCSVYCTHSNSTCMAYKNTPTIEHTHFKYIICISLVNDFWLAIYGSQYHADNKICRPYYLMYVYIDT